MSEIDPVQTGSHPNAGHERSDISVRAVVWFVIGLALSGGALHLLSHSLFVYLQNFETRTKASSFPLADEERGRPPSEHELEGIKKMEARTEAGRAGPYVSPEDLQPSNQPALNTFEWVDKEKGIVRIPIVRAMRTVLEKNLLPARKKEPVKDIQPSTKDRP
ncbi:MAG: hypothetical protein ACJ8FY_15165 [Gemmataceae bacterium]